MVEQYLQWSNISITDINKIRSHSFFYSTGGAGNSDVADITWAAFIAKTQGTPQNTAILIWEEGTVSKNDSKSSPPSPNPIPAKTCPKMALKENLYFLSWSSL